MASLKYKTRLEAFHSFFSMNVDTTKKSLNLWIGKLERECSTTGYTLGEEYIRAYNCLSYWYWCVGDQDKAGEYCELALEKNGSGIIALANKAWMLYHQCDFADCEDLCESLEKLSDDEFLVLDAESQQAYCYTRMGIRYARNAIDIFRKVVKHTQYQSSEETKSSFIMWKYGLGLSLRRLLNISNNNDPRTESECMYTDRLKETAIVFQEVIELSAHEAYKARAYVQLGDMTNSVGKMPETYPNGIKDIFPPKFHRRTSVEFYDEALKLGQNDVFVLERCGKQSRYTRDYDQAIECFQKALAIRQTSFAHHHLALTLKSILNRDVFEKARSARRALFNQRGQHYERFSSELQAGPPARYAGDYARSFSEGQAVNFRFERNMMARNNSGTGNYANENCYSPDSLEPAMNAMTLGEQNHCIHGGRWQTDYQMRYRSPAFAPAGQGRFPRGNQGTNNRFNRGHGGSHLRGQGFRRRRNADFFHGNRGRQSNFDRSRGKNSSLQGHSVDDSMSSPEKRQMSLMVKSPQNVQRVPDDDRSTEILLHLDKSIELGDNVSALYDKGIMKRALGQYKEAKDTFARVCRHQRASLMYKANSFEQQAWCLLEMSKDVTDTNEREKIDRNACTLLMLSVELTLPIASELPFLNGCWCGLQELLRRRGEDVTYLEQLSVAHENVGQYRKSLDLLHKVIEINPQKGSDPDMSKRRVAGYIATEDFTSAIVILDCLKCVEKSHVDLDQYVEANIEGGVRAIKDEEKELGKIRLKSAIDFQMDETLKGGSKGEDNDEELFDIYISCSDEESNSARCIWKIYKNTFGLSVTMNDDDANKGVFDQQGTMEVMKRSKHFVIVLEEKASNNNASIHMVLKMIEGSKGSRHCVVVRNTDEEVPIFLQRFPVLDFSLKIRDDLDYAEPDTSDSNYHWAKTLLLKLLKRK